MSKTKDGFNNLAKLQGLIVGRLSELNPNDPEDVNIRDACASLFQYLEFKYQREYLQYRRSQRHEQN